MPDTDPLAAALADQFGWPADGWGAVARAAREHIAAEVRAHRTGDSYAAWIAEDIAARIARGGTP